MIQNYKTLNSSIIDAGWLEFGHDYKPIIIVLHGFPQTAEVWIPVAKLLEKNGYRVIVPRLRGYTECFRPLGRLNYRTPCLSNDILRLMDHLGVETAHIAGHDLGASIAWDLAAYRPERVASIFSLAFPHPGGFLLDTFTSLSEIARAWYFLLAQFPLIPEILFSPARKASRKRFERFLAQKGLDRENAAKYLDQLSKDSLFTAAVNWYRAMPFLSIRRVLSKARVPASIIWGTDDAFTSRRSVELSSRFTASGFSVERIIGGSHWLLDDRPEDIARLISRDCQP